MCCSRVQKGPSKDEMTYCPRTKVIRLSDIRHPERSVDLGKHHYFAQKLILRAFVKWDVGIHLHFLTLDHIHGMKAVQLISSSFCDLAELKQHDKKSREENARKVNHQTKNQFPAIYHPSNTFAFGKY